MRAGLKIVPPGEGEIVGDTPTRRVEILCDDDAVNVTISRFGPGQEGADLHVHHRHSDFFYVLEGELTVRLGPQDEQLIVPEGSLARVPPGVIHGFRNASGAVMRYLNFHAPGCEFATYMRGLRDGVKFAYDQHDPPADGGRLISEAEVTDGDELTDVDALRLTRVRGSTEGRGPVAYFALEGDLVIGDATAPQGSWVQVPAGVEHAATGRSFLRVET